MSKKDKKIEIQLSDAKVVVGKDKYRWLYFNYW